MTISVPTPIFEEALRLSRELGVSLSEFCVAALTAYIAVHQSGDITKKLDEVYAKGESTLDPEVVTIQIASIGEQEGWWPA